MDFEGEQKFFDTAISATIDTTGENVSSLVLIPQGVTESTRIGREVLITRIQLLGHLIWRTDMTDAQYSQAKIRILLVLDKQANGASAGWTTLFSSDSANAFKNPANQERFEILQDWILLPEFGSGSTAHTSPAIQMEYDEECEIVVQWNGADGAITELQSNNLLVMAKSNDGDDIHTWVANWRVNYSDQ